MITEFKLVEGQKSNACTLIAMSVAAELDKGLRRGNIEKALLQEAFSQIHKQAEQKSTN